MENDILSTITAKSDQLNASDLIADSITVKVLDVKVRGTNDQPVSINIGEGHQPYKPCLSMRRVLAKIWGPSSARWSGHSMTLYSEESVTWAGETTGGIRISHVTGITEVKNVVVRASKHKVMSYKILPLLMELPAYSDEDIESKSEAWKKAFAAGSSPDNLVKSIKTQFTLTDQQIQTIYNMDGSHE